MGNTLVILKHATQTSVLLSRSAYTYKHPQVVRGKKFGFTAQKDSFLENYVAFAAIQNNHLFILKVKHFRVKFITIVDANVVAS